MSEADSRNVHEALRGRVNLKQVIVSAISQIPIATNETLQEHGVRPRDELVLFTSFGVVRGKLTADEEVGDAIHRMVKSSTAAVLQDVTARDGEAHVTAGGAYIVLERAEVFPPSGPAYSVAPLVVFVDSIGAMTFGMATEG